MSVNNADNARYYSPASIDDRREENIYFFRDIFWRGRGSKLAKSS